MCRLLRHVAEEILEGHQAGSASEYIVANLGFDIDHQLIENLKGLDFIFNERIALTVATQVDAVTEAVHLIEMFLPKFVDRAENRVAFDFF